MKKYKKVFFKVFLVLCIFIAFGFDVVTFSKIYKDSLFVALFNQKVLKLDIIGSLVFILLIFEYLLKQKEKEKNWVIKILSGILSLLMVFGNSYKNFGDASLVFDKVIYFIIAILSAIGYFYVFSEIILKVFVFFDNYKVKDSKNKFLNLLKKHPFIFSFVFVILCWLPYIIAFYPIILSPDPSYQIKQFFGIRTKYADYAILLDENVVMTNHHPVLHTILLGGCLKLGRFLVNDNFGLFIYSLIQIITLVSVFSFLIKYMLQKMNLSLKYCWISLIIFALVPIFPMYAMSAVKDVLFTAFLILYIVFLHNILKFKMKDYKYYHYLALFLVMMLVILFRNNGLYIILLSFPFIIFTNKEIYKRLLIIFILVLSFNFCYSKVILPYFKITPGSIREVLSIPFQQTARYVKYHGDELSTRDKKIIDKILGIDDLATRYNPNLADPVKNNYNKYATTDNLKKYFEVWFSGLLKHPVTYIDATIDNVYGYFYPNKLSWTVYYKYDNRIVEDGFNYHYNKLDNLREHLANFARSYPKVPVLGLISNISFMVWICFILTGYLIYSKRKKDIIVLLPALISILICVASPANTYFRYALPYIFSMPFMLGCILEKRK